MSGDLHDILSKFNDLGIVNKGLTVDDAPVTLAKKESADINPTQHATAVNESVAGKHIPGVSDVSATDFAALAGVTSAKPRPAPTPTPMAQNTVTGSNLYSVEHRLDKIERQLSSIFESIQKLTEISDEDYRAKRKALQDIQADPNTDKDPELQAELKRRKARLEKEREESKSKTKESIDSSLSKEFEEFLKGI